jgi:hypothetical protein
VNILNFSHFSGEILKELRTNEGPLTKSFQCKKEIQNKIWSPPPTTGYDGSFDIGVDYKFQDPETYTGPVVQGWEPGKFKQYQIHACFEQIQTCTGQVQTCLDKLQHAADKFKHVLHKFEHILDRFTLLQKTNSLSC